MALLLMRVLRIQTKQIVLLVTLTAVVRGLLVILAAFTMGMNRHVREPLDAHGSKRLAQVLAMKARVIQ